MRPIDADALEKRVQALLAHIKENDGDDAALLTVMQIIKSAPTVGGWISVRDRLPAEGQEVLVYMERDAWDKKGKHCRKKDIEKGWQINGAWHCDGCSRVLGLYWMPLLEPPKETEA